MPNITNIDIKKTRDSLYFQQRTAPLGGGLEYRVRPTINSQLNNFSWWAAGPIITTPRTFGLPLSSVVNRGSFPTSKRIMRIASTSNDDTNTGGIGARTLTITGLDEYFEPISESNIELSGQAPVDTSIEFFRVNGLFIDDTGSTNRNVGNIFCSDTTDTFVGGIPQNRVYCAMFPGENSDSWGQFTTKAHSTLNFLKGNVYTNATQSDPILFEERYTGPNFTGGRTDYTAGPLWYTSNISYNFDGGGAVGATTDIEWIASTSSGIREGTIYYELTQRDIVIDFDNVPTDGNLTAFPS